MENISKNAYIRSYSNNAYSQSKFFSKDLYRTYKLPVDFFRIFPRNVK